MPKEFSEDRLVQKTVADYFQKQLGWESIFAYNDEVLGEAGTLGRSSEREVILVRYLRSALEQYNPGLPYEAYQSAIRQLTETSTTKSIVQINREKYELHKNGVIVSVKNDNGQFEQK
jgi:type I restriction enzyme, R subunit